ncbi:hypothetical protein VKT23_019161 [Stygiomarasmius scandens]|uniref:Uncharacterized protein n=1 Tax=Marasmiellus scandens TaxID=2682957 RepID=A0ABR1IM55_9AGAR
MATVTSPDPHQVHEADEGWLSIETGKSTVANPKVEPGESPYQFFFNLMKEKDDFVELGRIRIRALEKQVAELQEGHERIQALEKQVTELQDENRKLQAAIV